MRAHHEQPGSLAQKILFTLSAMQHLLRMRDNNKHRIGFGQLSTVGTFKN